MDRADLAAQRGKPRPARRCADCTPCFPETEWWLTELERRSPPLVPPADEDNVLHEEELRRAAAEAGATTSSSKDDEGIEANLPAGPAPKRHRSTAAAAPLPPSVPAKAPPPAAPRWPPGRAGGAATDTFAARCESGERLAASLRPGSAAGNLGPASPALHHNAHVCECLARVEVYMSSSICFVRWPSRGHPSGYARECLWLKSDAPLYCRCRLCSPLVLARKKSATWIGWRCVRTRPLRRPSACGFAPSAGTPASSCGSEYGPAETTNERRAHVSWWWWCSQEIMVPTKSP